ncbi:MAG: adenylyltransferase/cytidyltransferase family protein [bacterium]|nr:adenylyltransferase/cytidyltransferase family protein [bacterium]
MKLENKVILVFGVFDRLHAGHLYFLVQAAKHGGVIAVVARDSSVQKLKNKKPTQNEEKRIIELKKTSLIKDAVLGDKITGAYEVVKKLQPDIICLGYDQTALDKDLRRYFLASGQRIKIIKIKAFKPDKLHTSLL